MWVCHCLVAHFSSILYEPPQPSLCPVRDIDPCVIVSRSFATQQFSKRPCEQVGLHMGVGSDYPELAEFSCGYF